MIISLDTETTGIDLYHGARPFLVTTSSDDCYGGRTDPGVQMFWEWDVDPETREVIIPDGDIDEIQETLDVADEIALQNAKFDHGMLTAVGIHLDWRKVRDTLRAGHLLGTNLRHDLYSMSEQYLRMSFRPLEQAMEDAVNECRSIVNREFSGKLVRLDRENPTHQPVWRIAREGLPEMPSAEGGSKKDERGVESERPWKFDTWLARRMAAEKKLPRPDPACAHRWPTRHKEWLCERCRGHRWWVVTSEYANGDSVLTLPLWLKMESLIEQQKLRKIYDTAMLSHPIAAEMERRGATVDGSQHAQLEERYSIDVERAERACIDIAAEYGAELTLPKGGSVNNSLKAFVFGELQVTEKLNGSRTSRWEKRPGLDLRPRGPEGYTATGMPSLDKNALDHWAETLEEGSLAKLFIQNFRTYRQDGVQLQQLANYKRFWIPLGIYNESGQQLWHRLHPSLNPTGTDHLRWSSSNPNEQNASKKEAECKSCSGNGCPMCENSGYSMLSLRRCFGPAPGREWWSADAENIELRIPAFEADETEVKRVFLAPEEPPYFGSHHLLVFDTFWPDLFAKHGKAVKTLFESDNYQWTKNGTYARQYGAQRKKADATFHFDGATEALAHRFPRIDALNKQYIRQGERLGYVETIPDKSVDPDRGYPILVSRAEDGRIIPTTPFCYHVSGTACWWMMMAMIRCQPQLEEWQRDGFDAFMTLQIHDELVFDMPKRAHPKVNPKASNLGRVRELKRLMEMGGDGIGVPTPVKFEYHEQNWAKGVAA